MDYSLKLKQFKPLELKDDWENVTELRILTISNVNSFFKYPSLKEGYVFPSTAPSGSVEEVAKSSINYD